MLYRVDPIVVRRSGGRNSLTTMLTGLPVVTLKVIGAKSGVERIITLVGIYDGETLILIASYFGNRKHPAWYYNLAANPKVRVVYQGDEKEYTAREAEGDERLKYWEMAEEYYPGYRNYKRWAGDREIPVMVLDPTE